MPNIDKRATQSEADFDTAKINVGGYLEFAQQFGVGRIPALQVS